LFRHLYDVIAGVVLFGDLLPNPQNLTLHPMTRKLMRELVKVSGPHEAALPELSGVALANSFVQWGKSIVEVLLPFLPRADGRPDCDKDACLGDGELPEELLEDVRYQYADLEQEESATPNSIPPLGRPQAPQLEKPNSPGKQLRRLLEGALRRDGKGGSSAVKGKPTKSSVLEELVKSVSSTMDSAVAADSSSDDVREELLTEMLGMTDFERGPIEGAPTSANDLQWTVNGKKLGGQIFDRPVELSDNAIETEALRREIAPITRELRRNLYPSERETPEIERIHISGQLDPQRLFLAETTDSVYRRHRIHRKRDPEGRAVMVVVADSSGSLTTEPMKMCKYLTAAWLESVKPGNIKVLAALYNESRVHNNVSGPLVRWIYHPRKTPVFAAKQGVRAVAALPDAGGGGQADALSLGYIVDEAMAQAKGSRIYLTLISDCGWCPSFPQSGLKPSDELHTIIKFKKEEAHGRLHMTLVSLGGQVDENLQKVFDKIVHVSREELTRPDAVAIKIGKHVAACIRERRAPSLTRQ
jgi:hypothetical protein